jgi:hypothetical protein
MIETLRDRVTLSQSSRTGELCDGSRMVLHGERLDTQESPGWANQ